MTQQTILNGAFEDDPSAETIYLAFGKVNNNFTELYSLIGPAADAEIDTSGNLVFPYQYGIGLTYNADGTLDVVTAVNGGNTWTMTYAYVGGNTDTITAYDGTSSWVMTFTWNPDNTLNNATGWV